jgi:hypothetical protein
MIMIMASNEASLDVNMQTAKKTGRGYLFLDAIFVFLHKEVSPELSFFRLTFPFSATKSIAWSGARLLNQSSSAVPSKIQDLQPHHRLHNTLAGPFPFRSRQYSTFYN